MASRAASEPRLDEEKRGQSSSALPSSAAPPRATSGLFDANPFAAPSSLPFGAPRFDLIRDEDYAPAIEEGMTRQLREVGEIVAQSEPPTFDNTFAALERSGQLLTRVLRVFAAVTSANTNERLQAIQADEAPRLAEHSDSIYLDDGLFARVRDVYDRRDTVALTPEQRRLVERYHLDFVRAGARLAAPDKARLRELNREEATLTTEFQSRLLEANKAASIVVEDVAQLDGLSPEEIASAAQLAAERGTPDSWAARDPEHDAAAGARVPARPRAPLPPVRGVGPPRRPRRSGRYPRRSSFG